ncbi:MAG: serpin family protein [Saprospiraceae bacterium]|nr:serpin family protein [Saprospiraceae bacterium]
MRYFVMLLVLVLMSCSKSVTDPTPQIVFSLKEGMDKSDAAFQLDLFREALATSDPGKNTVLSPLSVYLALSMVYHGSDGITRQEMREVLGLDAMTETEIQLYHQLLLDFLEQADARSTFVAANGIFYDDQRINPYEEFLGVNGLYYDAEIKTLDFAAATAPQDINQWVDEKTNGLIEKIIESIREEESMFVLNTLYYKGGWSDPFNEELTSERNFQKANGSEELVQMMSKDETLDHVIHEDYSAVDLPLGDSVFSMTLLVPHQESARDFAARLTAGDLETIWDQMRSGRTLLSVPRFEVSVKLELKETLESMGMPTAFSNGANFTRLGSAAGNIFLTRVDHKTYLKVDEKGAEGAAVTSVGVGVTSLPPMVQLDRPFLFILRDRTFNQIVFIGLIENPNEAPAD